MEVRKRPRDRGNESRIAKKRLAAGLTQKQLADKVGVTQITLSRWEGGIQTPSGCSLVGLATALGCHVEELI